VGVSYSIKTVAAETGLSPHTIRAWERRYQTLTPGRTGTNRRAYGERDLARLKLLARAVRAGHSIGAIAHATDDELQNLVSSLDAARIEPASQGLAGGLSAIAALDGPALEASLSRSAQLLGVDRFLEEVAQPMIGDLDEGWQSGRITIAQEHLASAAFRSVLDRLRREFVATPGARRMLVTTPSGQLHELGALLAAVVAAAEGWSVIYVGPNLPVEEIVQAALTTRADAIALSIVFPEHDPGLDQELIRLRQALPHVQLILGGRAAGDCADIATRLQAVVFDDLGSFRSFLRSR
jgi:DNA-binding transcriptional MerR regulator/methylmalonyl-CoA mutase cobalamin-binding subunit